MKLFLNDILSVVVAETKIRKWLVLQFNKYLSKVRVTGTGMGGGGWSSVERRVRKEMLFCKLVSNSLKNHERKDKIWILQIFFISSLKFWPYYMKTLPTSTRKSLSVDTFFWNYNYKWHSAVNTLKFHAFFFILLEICKNSRFFWKDGIVLGYKYHEVIFNANSMKDTILFDMMEYWCS